MNIHFLNGSLVEEDELLISPRDLGYLRGYSIFEFLRTYSGGKPFMLKRHVDRLYNSAEAIGMLLPWDKAQIIEWVQYTLNANDTNVEKVIRIIISGGVSHTFSLAETPTIIIMIDDVVALPKKYYENGVNAYLVEHKRYKPMAKTTSYIDAIYFCQTYKIRDVDEIIYHKHNIILEGHRSNVFVVTKDKLITPKTDILGGITRGVLLEILDIDKPVVVDDVSVEDLYNAEEVFVTASAKEIMPITKINTKNIGAGTVGPITRQVIHQFKEYVSSNKWWN